MCYYPGRQTIRPCLAFNETIFTAVERINKQYANTRVKIWLFSEIEARFKTCCSWLLPVLGIFNERVSTIQRARFNCFIIILRTILNITVVYNLKLYQAKWM